MQEKYKSMSNVPNLRFPEFDREWEVKKLGEVAEIGRGKSKHRPRDADFLFGGKYPFIQTGDIRKADLYLTQFTQTYSELGLKQSKLWDENTLCITIAANIAETAILKIKACFPDSIIGLIPKEDKTIVLFVKHLFDKFKIQIQSLSQGAAQDNLNQEKLSKIELAFPTLPEQQKITSLLSIIDERISTQNKIIEELKVLKSSISKKIFSQQLRFKDENGNDFPDWKGKTLGEICEIIGGGTPETNKIEYWNGSIQWFTPTEIKTNFVSKSERTITETGLKKSSAKILPKGTILLTTRATIGEVSIALEECTTNQGFQSLVMKKGYNNLFIFNWLKENKYELTKRANGSTFPEISKSEIEKIELNIPNISEQNHIADFLSSIDKKIEVENLLLYKLQTQKQYLLSNLFI